MTAFRDGQVTLRRLRRTDGYTEADKEIGYHGVEVGDLAVHAMDGFAGAIGVSEAAGKMSPVVHLYRAGNGSERYYSYVLRQIAIGGYVASLAKGIRERSTSFDPAMLADVVLPVPPLSEQRRIAAFLDDQVGLLDQAISLRKSQLALAIEQHVAHLDSLVRQGFTPDAELVSAEYAPFGLIPRSWKQGRLRSTRVEVQTGPFGSQLGADEYVDDGWPVVNPSNITREGRLVANETATVDEATRERLSRHVLRLNDVVFGRRGDLGRAGLVTEGEVGWVCGTGSLRVRFLEAAFDPAYLTRLLRLPSVHFYFEANSVGSTMQNLNTSLLLGMPLLIPSLTEQHDIARRADALADDHEQFVQLLKQSVSLLAERKQALITAAVTGNFDVSAARRVEV